MYKKVFYLILLKDSSPPLAAQNDNPLLVSTYICPSCHGERSRTISFYKSCAHTIIGYHSKKLFSYL